jgi:AcrR family transcriptional regulator
MFGRPKMAENGQERPDTRQRVLESAIEVFAEKGFHEATVHDICEGADANIAAVNYYFGSKEELYVRSWEQAFENSMAAYPPDGGVPPTAPPEERLRGHMGALVRRLADPNTSKEFSIIHHELASPTGLLADMHRKYLRPMREQMRSLLLELLGPRPSEQQVKFCQMGVIGMGINPLIHRRLNANGARAELPGPPPIEDIEAYIEHIVRFALAGIAAVREAAERAAEGD